MLSKIIQTGWRCIRGANSQREHRARGWNFTMFARHKDVKPTEMTGTPGLRDQFPRISSMSTSRREPRTPCSRGRLYIGAGVVPCTKERPATSSWRAAHTRPVTVNFNLSCLSSKSSSKSSSSGCFVQSLRRDTCPWDGARCGDGFLTVRVVRILYRD